MSSCRDSRFGMTPPKPSVEIWWWVRVLPPPGTLIWRLPGFIKPRCTAGATHRFAESYYGFNLHFSKIPRQRRNVINEKESQVLSKCDGRFVCLKGFSSCSSHLPPHFGRLLGMWFIEIH